MAVRLAALQFYSWCSASFFLLVVLALLNLLDTAGGMALNFICLFLCFKRCKLDRNA